MPTADEIVVKLTAQTDQLNAGMAEASATVQASTDAMSASFKTSTAAFAEFDAIQKGNLKTAEQVAQAQSTINAVQQTGAFTSEELAAKQALVDAAMLKVGKSTQEASGALSLLTSNSRTMYSTSAFITDAMTGQFSRMRREVAALGNETGLMAKAFQFAVSPVGLVAAAVVALGVAAEKGASEFSGFQQAIELTNNAAGVSAGDMVAIASRIGALTGSYGDAQEAVEGLAASGRFAGAQLEQAATAAAQFASATGMKVSEVEKFIEEMATNPKRALDDLENKYHAIDSAQADQIRSLLRVGDQADATAAELDAFAKRGSAAMDDVAEHARGLIGVFDRLGAAASGAWATIKENMFVDLGGGDAAEQLDSVNKQIETMKRLVSHGVLAAEPEVLVLEHERSLLQQQVDAMHEKETAAKQIAAAEHLSDAPEKGSLAALRQQGFGGVDLTGNLTKQMHDLEAIQKVSYANREDFESQYWGEVLHHAQAGSAAYVQAWQQTQSNLKRLDDEQKRASDELERKREENARKGAAAARRAAEAAKQAAELRARAEQQASDEIQAEAKKEATAMHASDMAKITSARQVGLARIDAARQQAQTEFDSGNISAGALLQVEQQLVQRKLAEEMRYYQRKLALDQGDVAAQQADMSAITAAQLKADQTMSANTDKFIKDDERKWKSYGQRIAGAFQNATNSMLFQGQTLRQGLASVAESIFETFVEAVVNKPLQAFIAGEGEKLAAAIGFGSQKTAEEETQRAINAAADSADKAAAAARAAGLAGAQGVASFAAAPWPIDMGAPAFGAAMFAEATAFGAVASAAGGWDRVPADGVQTILHKDEMVLPKHVADPVRNMAKSGGSGASNHFHINAMDARSFRDFLKRNPGAVSAALGHAGRNGWT